MALAKKYVEEVAQRCSVKRLFLKVSGKTFREIQGNQGKLGNLILASKVRELSGNLRKSWPKSGEKI